MHEMSVDELRSTAVDALQAGAPREAPEARRITVARLGGRTTGWALAAAAVAAVGYAIGTVVAGRLAVSPSGLLVALLALCVVGGAILDTAGRAAWAGVVDVAEGRLRADLLTAALHQPL